MTWTDEIVAKLAAFVKAGRMYRVEIEGDHVFAIDPRKPEEGDAGWPAYYIERGFDNPLELEAVAFEDVKVIPLTPIEKWWEVAEVCPGK